MKDALLELIECHEMVEQAERDLSQARRDYRLALEAAFRSVCQSFSNENQVCFVLDGYVIEFKEYHSTFGPNSVRIIPLTEIPKEAAHDQSAQQTGDPF